jgi:hypothetical protein
MVSGTTERKRVQVIRELIHFELRLGPDTDRFRALFRQVRERMERAGVVPGAVWTNLTGDARYFIVERTFSSLAQYEQDDGAFHSDAELMSIWREMEGCLVSMRVDLWQQIYPGSHVADGGE